MAEYLIQESTLTSMADKIRSLSGTTEKMTLAEMSSALDGLSGGSGGGGETVKLPFGGGTVSAMGNLSAGLDAYSASKSPTGYTECAGFIPGTPIAGYVAYNSKGRCWTLEARNCSTVSAEIPDGEADFVITHVTTA